MAVLAKRSVSKINFKRPAIRMSTKVQDNMRTKRILEEPLTKLKRLAPKLKSEIPDIFTRLKVMLRVYENSHKEIEILQKEILKHNNSTLNDYLNDLRRNREQFLRQFHHLKDFINSGASKADLLSLSTMQFTIVDIPLSAYLNKKKLIEYELSKLNTKRVPATVTKADHRGPVN